MWGAILKLLSGIVELIPKVRKWGVTSKAARETDEQHRRIDDSIDAPPRVPDTSANNSHGER